MKPKKLSEIKSVPIQLAGKDYIPFYLSNYTVLAGNGGVGKSLITLKMVIHYLLENKEKNAYCLFTEDTRDQIEERIDNIVYNLPITKEEVLQRTDFITIEDYEGEVFCYKERDKIIKTKHYQEIIDYINENNIGVVVIDPFESFHSGLSENNESDMKEYVMLIQSIGVKTNTGVLVLHHTPKGDKSGYRGSGVIVNKGRLAYNIRKNTFRDENTNTDQVYVGWEKSVVLSVIKDNNYVQRYCDIIVNKNGKLDLPIIDEEDIRF